MSQRLNAGANWPRLAVSARDELGVCPEPSAWCARLVTDRPIRAPLATARRFRSTCASADPPGVFAVGVAQPATACTCAESATPPSWLLRCWRSSARGVDQPATVGRSGPVSGATARQTPFAPSAARAVGHPVTATATSFSGRPAMSSLAAVDLPSRQSRAVGVGHADEVEALSDVRGADARSAQIRSPDGVARSFQVSAYSGEPVEASSARNLLAKKD